MKDGLIKISCISLKGNTLFPQYGITKTFLHTRLNQLYSHLDENLNMAAINKIADAITLAYREKGLTFNRAYISPQEIKNSTLTIYVQEGILSEIDIYDNSLYSNEQISNPFKHLIGKVIYEPDILQVVNNLNSKPGLKLFAYFSTGSMPGESRLNIKIQRETVRESAVSTDNKGITQTGQNRLILSHTENNPLKLSGRFTTSILTTNNKDNIFGGISYHLPLSEGTLLGASYIQSEFSVTGQFSNLGLSGTLTSLTGFISTSSAKPNTLTAASTKRLSVSYKESKISSKAFPDILNTSIQYATLNTLYFYNYSATTSSRHKVTFTPTLGLIDESDDTDISKSFFVLATNYHFLLSNWITIENLEHALSSTFSGKWTHQQLPPPEQFSVTGPTTNRGYRPGIFSGDIGYNMSIEEFLNWNISSISWAEKWRFQSSLFFDYSYGKLNSDELYDASFSSAGVTITANYQKFVSLGLSIGKPLNHTTSSTLDIDTDTSVIYANINIKF